MSDLSQPLSTSTDAPRILPMHWVESLFQRMLFSYGSKFSEQWRGVDPGPMKQHWAEKLGGLSGPELKHGVSRLDTLDWPPSLPQFLKLCKPSVDPLVAYYEAVAGVQARAGGHMGTWTHPAIFWASMPIAFDLGTQTYSQIKIRWERALDEQMSRGEWAAVPAPALALPAPGKAEMSRERAAELVAQYNAGQIVKKVDPESIGDRHWAKKIMDRAARRDSSLPSISITFAKQALGLA